MARYQVTGIAADGNGYVFTIKRPRTVVEAVFTMMVSGTFGGGTVAPQISFDGGTTRVPLYSGATAVTWTGAGAVTFRTGAGHSVNDQPQIFYALTGSTAPNLTITVWDNS